MTTMTHGEILLTIFGMSVVSYIPRVLPPLFLSNRKIPRSVENWLKFVPTSVFGALVFSEIFVRPGYTFDFSMGNIALWASLIVTAVACKTRSIGASIVSGLASFWLLQHYL